MTANGDTTTRTRASGWVAASVLLGFGLLYAWDLFEAVSNLQQLVAYVDALNARDAELIDAGLQAAVVPWAPAIAVILLPPVVFAIALVLGRRRALGVRALCLVAGLAVVAAVTLSVTALA